MAIKKTTKKAAKKVGAKKTPAKKAVKTSTGSAPRKAAAKKSAAKKAPGKAPAKKAAKKAAKKVAPQKAPTTTIIANVDAGFGNTLYLRGEGAGLSWDEGTAMENVSPYEWSFRTTAAKGEVTFKFLINDEAWSDGENLTVAAGGTSVSSPVFNW